MSSTGGNHIKISLFGESHSKSIGIVVDGLPAGEPIDQEALLHFMARRSSKGGKLDTPRLEADFPEIQSGIVNGRTCGTPVCAVIQNSNTQSKDYEQLRQVARPGHADYTGYVRYHGCNDIRGGGHFSGRLTAPLVFAGGLCKQILRRRGIEIGAHIASIGSIQDRPFHKTDVTASELCRLQELFFPVLEESIGEQMQEAIGLARENLDSLGGVIECAAVGLQAGLGDPIFDCVESRLSSLLFGIPAVKGVEFGSGFALAAMSGKEGNDPFVTDGQTIRTTTNHNGGILGGITNGMPLVFRVAMKPTPSIAQKQQTVNFVSMENTELAIRGRHDPCIVRRAVPCIESAAALALLDLMS